MGLTIFATRNGKPLFSASRHIEAIVADDARERWERGEPTILPNPDYTPGAGADMARESFVNLLDLLDLPQTERDDGTLVFDVRQIKGACDEALDRFDERLLKRGFGHDLRNFWLQRMMQIRDIAVVGLSQGADKVVAN